MSWSAKGKKKEGRGGEAGRPREASLKREEDKQTRRFLHSISLADPFEKARAPYLKNRKRGELSSSG